MALSEYEEQVVAELEAQFRADDAPPVPRLSFGRLALPTACFLGGVGLLVAAHQVGLVIRISDFWGFSTSSIASTLSLTGYAMLLGWAFLLGQVLYELRQQRPGRVGIDRSMSPAGAATPDPDSIRPRQ